MKKLFTVLFFVSLSVSAMDQAMIEMMKTMKLDKATIASTLDQLEELGRITPEQSAEAKKELEKLNDEDLDNYKKVAVKKIENGDANRLLQHDFTKGTPTSEPASVIERSDVTQRVPSNSKSSEAAKSGTSSAINFSKLGQ